MAKHDEEAPGAIGATHVFISYSRRDTDFVSRLGTALDAKGYDAFLDTEDISGGEEWKSRLDQLILAADAVIFVMSPDSIASPVCDWESKRALELGKRLIPILWRPLGAEQQPPEQLSERNYIFFDTPERFDAALTQLCNACDVDIGWVREHTRLVELATRWDKGGRKRDLLLRGDERAQSDAWRAARAPRAPAIPATLIAFLEASQTAEKRARRQRQTVLALIFGMALTVLAGGGVWLNWSTLQPITLSYLNYKRFAHSSATLMSGATGPSSSFQDCQVGSSNCPEMIVLPAGQFMMGSPADEGLLDTSDERPPHAVSIPRFAVSKYDITFAQWQACVTFGGCRTTPNPDDQFWGRRTRPVINVAPEDAQEYVAWLSQVTGQTYRLLSEAEWEYAARGYSSLNDPHYRYPWGDAAPVCDRNAPNGAAFDHCLDRDRRTFPVGSFRPNRFGLYDMAGNVSQWVQDCYAESYSQHPANGSAFVRSFCAGRVTRGGSWDSPAERLRSSTRRMEYPHLRDEETGFRVARAL